MSLKARIGITCLDHDHKKILELPVGKQRFQNVRAELRPATLTGLTDVTFAYFTDIYQSDFYFMMSRLFPTFAVIVNHGPPLRGAVPRSKPTLTVCQ
jgi:hypothetical protein